MAESTETTIEVFAISSSTPLFRRVLQPGDRIVVGMRELSAQPVSGGGDGDGDGD